MHSINVTLRDTATDKLCSRDIDISNFTVYNALNDTELQSELLKEWIEDRANEQHNSVMSLVSWYIH
jgi:hypothetical protein